MSEDWTEKYRPKTLKDVVGNPSATNEMLSWAKSWDMGIPEKKALILIGTPGVGKTTSAEALAIDMGWGIVEMNASDQRTGDIIRDIAVRGANSNTFDSNGNYLDVKNGGRKLIVLDEADNLFGSVDKGALPAINELIKTTKQPVILIVNDFYALSKKSSAIKTDTIQITFRKPTSRAIVAALAAIAKKENITIDTGVLDRITSNSNGDMRAAIRDLESLGLGTQNISYGSADQISERNIKKDMYAVVDAIFRKNDPGSARAMLSKADSDPETAILWVDENLPYEYREPGDLVRGYEKLCRADVYLGRVHRRQYYRFWAYASDMMTMGVATARMNSLVSHERIRFPMYLSKMSHSKNTRALKYSICYKLAVLNHTSTKRVEFDILPNVKQLCRNSEEYCVMLVKDATLEPEELGYLIDKKIDSEQVKKAFLKALPPKETTQIVKKPEPIVDIPPVIEQIQTTMVQDAQSKPETKKTQRNLFEF